jgi:uncharacterized protein YjbI with pentapeptide repeats
MNIIRGRKKDSDVKEILDLTKDNFFLKNDFPKDLRNLNFSKVILTGVNLTKANLSGANLREANLTGANLTNAILIGANLTGANLQHDSQGNRANLTGANLTNAKGANNKEKGANFTGADLTNAILIGANLTNSDFTEAILIGANLSGANLTGAKFDNSTLRGTDLRRATNIGDDAFKNVDIDKVYQSFFPDKIANNPNKLTILLDFHGYCPLNFFLVPKNVTIKTKSDIGSICYAADKADIHNFYLYDSQWIYHTEGHIISDFMLEDTNLKILKSAGIFIQKGGAIKDCNNNDFIAEITGKNKKCIDNEDSFLKINEKETLLSKFLTSCITHFPDKEIEICISACNYASCTNELHCFSFTGDLHKDPTLTATFLKNNEIIRKSARENITRENFIEITKTLKDHHDTQDFSKLRRHNYFELAKFADNDILTEIGKKKLSDTIMRNDTLIKTFNMKTVCFLIICAYIFFESGKFENIQDAETTTKKDTFNIFFKTKFGKKVVRSKSRRRKSRRRKSRRSKSRRCKSRKH